MTRIGALAVLALLTACGTESFEATTTVNNKQEPVKPTGTVSGVVTNSHLRPLAGARVALTVGAGPARETTADESGSFSFTGVPAGASFLATLSHTGYGTVRTSGNVPAAAGDFPLQDSNVSLGAFTLMDLGGTLVFNVLDPSGRPANGAKATLQVSAAGSQLGGSGLGTNIGVTAVDATVDGQGRLTFSGVPAPVEAKRYDVKYDLWVMPLDVNVDGLPETGGTVQSYDPTDLVKDGSPRLLTLPLTGGATANPAIASSNVGSLRSPADKLPFRNFIRPDEPVFIAFNQPMRAESVLVRLTDEHGSELLATSNSVGAGGLTLTITPTAALTAGNEYNIQIRALSAAGKALQTTGWFIAGDVTSPPAASLREIRYQETSTAQPARLNPGERVYVYLNQVAAHVSTDDKNAKYAQVLFRYDIDGDFKIGGTTRGEADNASGMGFDLVPDEPLKPLPVSMLAEPRTPFDLQKSGYTTRFSFVYEGANLVNVDPTLAEVVIAFDKMSQHTGDLYQTAWGVPITTQMKAGLLVRAPPTEN